ncbi:DUF2142 domain-containing protein [Agromyces kandeliae]|uniref:DUF2142 domain-containing protein n=1 Tax=Agromyces kandeliae TaxID=2666141 RepID=A0A6L5QZ19_9MICO|nr:DUF2142 domain-containing protein [Agromyces kandeliae]MRX42895.1 DUF2142 domain-containing protein [Agromyces kandeliae]
MVNAPAGAGARRSAANRAGLVGFALTAFLGILWAFASPIFSVPDENAHATKAIAQVRGQLIGDEVEGVLHLVVRLPDEYRYDPALLCYVDDENRSADCGVALGDEGGQDWFNTWTGAYNPVYYALVGWPSLVIGGDAGVIAMRIVSALIGALFVGAAFQLAVAGTRARWMPLALAFSALPMCVYLMGSVNPNGLEIAASVALWVAVLRLFEAHGHGPPAVFSRTWMWVVVTLASAALVTARALGPLWLVVIVALAALTVGWAPVRSLFTTARSYLWLGIIAVFGLFSLGWTLVGGSLSSQAREGDAPLVGAGFLEGVVYMLRLTDELLQQAIGEFGWLDTVIPAWALWSVAAVVGAVVFLAVGSSQRRDAVVIAVVIAACVVVPVLVQARSVGQTGIIWQGRYGLFLYLGALIVICHLLSRRTPDRIARLSVRYTWLGGVLLAAFGAYVFLFVMYRYVVGLDDRITEMVLAPEWQPPGGWPLLVTLYAIASAAYAAFIGRLGVLVARLDSDLAPVDVAAVARATQGDASGSPSA